MGPRLTSVIPFTEEFPFGGCEMVRGNPWDVHVLSSMSRAADSDVEAVTVAHTQTSREFSGMA